VALPFSFPLLHSENGSVHPIPPVLEIANSIMMGGGTYIDDIDTLLKERDREMDVTIRHCLSTPYRYPRGTLVHCSVLLIKSAFRQCNALVAPPFN
jgi:hypothetical protein